MIVIEPCQFTLAKKVSLRLHPPWKSDETKDPWEAVIEKVLGVPHYKTYKAFQAFGFCKSETFHVPGVGTRAHAIVRDCLIEGEGLELKLISAAFELPPALESLATDVMVRLNTEWLVDETKKPWRVVLLRKNTCLMPYLEGHGEYLEEYFVDDFCIHGAFGGGRYDFAEPVGRKMNLVCRGSVTLTGTGSKYVYARINTVRV